MATNRWMLLSLVCVAGLALGADATDGDGPSLELHWNKATAASVAVVKNSEGDVLAETVWGGALPRRYSADEEETEVPILVLGHLRDQLHASSQPGSEQALDFVRELMDLYADMPVDQLAPSLGTWIAYGNVSVQESCGTAVDTDGECTAPAGASLQNSLCSESACKRTVIRSVD
jgi:hypothetical protein